MAILRPLLAETGAMNAGTVVIGTVKGDIHDIGKNLVAMMLEGAGFEVFDLGVNTDADTFIAAIEEHQADILGHVRAAHDHDAYMKVVIDELKGRGLRDEIIVLVGGAPLNEEFGMAVGADAYCRDAAVAAETARPLVAQPDLLRHPASAGSAGPTLQSTRPAPSPRPRYRSRPQEAPVDPHRPLVAPGRRS